MRPVARPIPGPVAAHGIRAAQAQQIIHGSNFT